MSQPIISSEAVAPSRDPRCVAVIAAIVPAGPVRARRPPYRRWPRWSSLRESTRPGRYVPCASATSSPPSPSRRRHGDARTPPCASSLALLAEHNVGALVVSADGTDRRRHRLRARRGAPAAQRRRRCSTATVESIMTERRAHLRARRPARRPDVADDRAPDPARAGRARTTGWSASSASATWSSTRSARCEFERDQLDSYVHQS